MKYTKTAVEKAEQTLSERRLKVQSERNERLAEIEMNAPEIANMNRNLISMNCEMVKLIGQGRSNINAREFVEQIKEKNYSTRKSIREMLVSFGYPEDYLQYRYFCPKCKDTGFIEGKRCECFEKLLAKYTTDELNENCLIKLHDFSEFRIDFYPETNSSINPRAKMNQVFADCKNYANNFSEDSPSLFLFGGTGLGKTFLSSCIANKLLKDGRNVVFGSILDLFRKIESEHFGRSLGNTADIIINAELVILDDLGSEFQTSFTDSVLYEILNDRLNLGKPTIISTNLTMEELNKKYNERIVSRLTGFFVPFLFLGNDIRPAVRSINIRNIKK